MEFLVEFEINVPDGTPASEVKDRENAEAAAAAKLVAEGHLVRVWKRAGDRTILGLYRGPVGRGPVGRGPHHSEPTSIVLYRKNLARAVKTRAELCVQIRETLLHEIGHLEGLDEDDLRRRGMD